MKKKSLFLVLTLVSSQQGSFKKYDNLIRKILNKYNIKVKNSNKLAPFVKDFFFLVENKDLIKELNKIFNKKEFLEVDICVQETEKRRKKIIACDMDMTAIKEETINMIGDRILKNNKITNLTEKAMSGEMKFQNSIILRTKMLKGIIKSKVLNILKDIRFTPGIDAVIKTMNYHGYHTMLITGGYNLIAEYVGEKIGFKEVICNSLKIENNVITGKLDSEIIDKERKLKYFKKSILQNNLKSFETLAIGDGDNDIKMIRHASLGIAWKAYPKVREAADVCIENDLKSILYFQGYRKGDFLN